LRIVKLKVDNTYLYSLPPILLENFIEFMIESSIGQAKLRELKERYNEFK